MNQRLLRLSSARLAAVFVLILAGGVTVLLATVYVLTARVLDREVDSVIRAEVSGLVDDYERGGLLQLLSALRRPLSDSFSCPIRRIRIIDGMFMSYAIVV